jgi:ABC-type multidrug transport system ATPase subunit
LRTREYAFEASELTKRYRRLVAVDAVSMHVPRGQVYGLLGQNGAGKTTLLSMLLGTTFPSSGTLRRFGATGQHAMRRIGGFLENPSFYPYLTAWENLQLAAKVKGAGAGEIEAVLKTVRLWERRSSPFKSFSLGMKKRLGLASAVLGDPDVLVLDEPTNGLDPEGIAEMRSFISDFARGDKTVVVSSHLLGEVEKYCTHVGIMDRGRLVAQSSVADLRSGRVYALLRGPDPARIHALVGDYPLADEVERKGDDIIVTMRDGDLSRMNEYLANRGVFLSHLSKGARSLEDAFFELLAHPRPEASVAASEREQFR